MFPKRYSHRYGFTLIELLVTISIIGILVALLIPAVQSSRAAARRISCVSNLKQLGIAAQSYHALYNVFPASYSGAGHSPFVALLPYLEQASLFSSINMSGPRFAGRAGLNVTAENTVLNALLCPDDVGNADAGARTNYAANVGYGFQFGRSTNGMFGANPVGVAGVKDGTTQTVLFAEWVLGVPYSLHDGPPPRSSDQRMFVFDTPPYDGDQAFEAFVSYCSKPRVTPLPAGLYTKGIRWMRAAEGMNLYNHDIGLNGPSCTNNGGVPNGAWTAGSRHPGGVQVVFADGHVRLIQETINLTTWRSMGTRAGGESTELSSY